MERLPEKLGTEYYRSFLTQQGQMFYDCINAQLLRKDYSGQTIFPISKPETSASDCFASFKAIRDDHPEYFYLGFQSEFVCRGTMGILKYPILYNPETIGRIRAQMRKCIYNIIRGTAYLDVIDREALVYERISKRMVYSNHNDVRDHNIVGPVLLSSGVCEGHNALLLLCLRRIGIPCIKVYGKTQNGDWHCWTIAWINGVSVHCDVTWDGGENSVVQFNYFNLSDRQISWDHYDFKGVRTPACMTETFSYHNYRRLYVHSYHDLKKHLQASLHMGAETIRLHFAYKPMSGNYLDEVKQVFQEERVYDSHKLYYHPGFKNLTIERF